MSILKYVMLQKMLIFDIYELFLRERFILVLGEFTINNKVKVSKLG